MRLFGGSSSASASNSAHTESVEHYHDTVIYVDDEDSDYDSYENHADGYEDVSAYDDSWDADDYGSDDHGDSYDDD